MAAPVRSVLLVAERLGVHDDGWSIVPFLDRMESHGVTAQVLCLEAAGDAGLDDRVVECPGLGHRWRLPFAVRNLRFGEELNRPDLIHVLRSRLSEPGLALAEHLRIPYVLTVDEFLPPDGRLRVSRRWCRRLVAASHELADELRRSLGVANAHVAAINPGIDPPSAEPPAADVLDRRVTVVGTAGPLVTASGFATFLNAARRVIDSGVDAEFVIAGQGEDEVDLRRRAERLKITDRVTFAGIPVVGLRFWNVLDIFCQPSLVPSVGRTLATALAFGVPSVASDIQGLRALVRHDRNGLRVPPGDSGSLAQAVLTLRADPARARALGAAGQAMILGDFDPEEEVRRLVSVYAEALAAAPPRTWAAAR